MEERWYTCKGYFVLINLLSIVFTLAKLFGWIGNDIPWWFVAGPLIFDIILVVAAIIGVCILIFYGSIYDSLQNKKNSHK